MDIRLIAEEDGAELLKWRNDPVTQEMSLNAGIVSTGDHCGWLKSKLESCDCSLFLGVEGDNKIGVCRFDIDKCGECAEVSITMNPDFRGKGKAKYLLATALDEFQKNKQRAIYARIKIHNLPSLKAFEGVGFKRCLKNQEFVFSLFSPPHLVPKFEKVRKCSDHVDILYHLLIERQHSISHKRMPSNRQHEAFVNSDPYRLWQLIYLGPECLGSVYLKFDNTIGFNLKRTQVDIIAQSLNLINSNYELCAPVDSYVANYFSINVPHGNLELYDNLRKIGLIPIQSTLKFG